MKLNKLTGSIALAIVSTVHAAPIDDLRNEIAEQKARVAKLEAMLNATSTNSTSAQKSGLPAGFSIYGIADAGVEVGNYGQGTKTRIQSGLGSASRLGFKGERNIADTDLTAYFQLEAGISFDNGQNTGHSSNVSNPAQGTLPASASVNTNGVALFSRNTFVGLNSKSLGDFRFGRDYAPIYSLASASDPFSIGGATAFRMWSSAAASRFDNGFFYATPKKNGFQGKLAMSAGMENNSTSDIGVSGGAISGSADPWAASSTGPKNEGKGASASVTYEDGPLYLGMGYLSYYKMGTVASPATDPVQRTSWNLAATYDLKYAKLFGHYLHGEDTQTGATNNKPLDRDVWWLGAAVPLKDRHTVRAVYGRLNDKTSSNKDSTHYGVGYEYALDSLTDLYAYYATVSNQNGGKNSLCAGGTCQGYDGDSGLPANFTPKSLMVGGRYRF